MEQKNCFIIMPFTSARFGDQMLDKAELSYIYGNIIKRAVADFRMEGQPFFSQISRYESKVGSIIDGIASQLNEADLVIADLTGMNPNVMYELGVRHTLRRGTIIISQDLKELPSDLRDYMCVEYSFSKNTIEQEANYLTFCDQLHHSINEVFSTHKPDSPVLNYLNGKGKYWKEDELKILKKNLVIAAYLLEQFYKIKECVEAIETEEGEQHIEGYFNVTNIYLNNLHGALSDLAIGVETSILYENQQAAISLILDISKKANIGDTLPSIFLMIPEQDQNIFTNYKRDFFASQYVNHFKLNDNEFERIGIKNVFSEDGDFYLHFVLDLQEYLETKADELGLSEEEIDFILKN